MNTLTRAPRHGPEDEAVDDILGDDVDFAHYVVAIWRRRWLLAAVSILCGAGAAGIALLQVPVYEASVTLAVSRSKLGDGAPVVSANFRPLIENNSIAARVIEELKLAGAPHFMTPERFRATALSVEDIRNSNLITVSVSLRDPALAAQAANRVADLATHGARRLNQDEAVHAREELAAEVVRAKKDLEATSASLEGFRNSAQVELAREDVKSLLEERGKLLPLLVDVEAARAKVRRGETELAARQRLDALSKSIDTEPALLEAARSGEPSRSLLSLRLRSEEVNKVYEAIEEQLAKDRAELAELEARRAQLVDVRRLGAQRQAQLTALYGKEAELARLTTEHELAEKFYADVAARYATVRLEIANRSAQLQVIDHAVVPGTPRSRHLVRNAVFALLAGAALMSVGIVLIQALSDMLRGAPRR